jgi:hypothetical protein
MGQDTVFGSLVAVRPEALVLAGIDEDSLTVGRHTIEHVDVDRTRRHWWSGTVAQCVLAGSYVGLTTVEASRDGWSWRVAHGALMSALFGKAYRYPPTVDAGSNRRPGVRIVNGNPPAGFRVEFSVERRPEPA